MGPGTPPAQPEETPQQTQISEDRMSNGGKEQARVVQSFGLRPTSSYVGHNTKGHPTTTHRGHLQASA